jgi:hypothetical protein
MEFFKLEMHRERENMNKIITETKTLVAQEKKYSIQIIANLQLIDEQKIC